MVFAHERKKKWKEVLYLRSLEMLDNFTLEKKCLREQINFNANWIF